MAKDKSGKGGAANKHMQARLTYLQQAATYLTTQALGVNASAVDQPGNQQAPHLSLTRSSNHNNGGQTDEASKAKRNFQLPAAGGLPLYLNTHMRQVARKSQIRLRRDVKRAICKTCNALLVEGGTSHSFMENKSRGGRKPHADVAVITCTVCGTMKRFPVGARRQKKNSQRHGGEDSTALDSKG